MEIRRFILFFILICHPLAAAYTPNRYISFIRQHIQELEAQTKVNEEKIKTLKRSQAYTLKRKKERERTAFEQQINPVIEGTATTLRGLQQENRLLQTEIAKLSKELTPGQLSTLTDEKMEEHAVRKIELESSLDVLQRNAARAEVAHTFFDTQKRNSPALAKDFEQLQKQWDKKLSALNTQATRQKEALRALR